MDNVNTDLQSLIKIAREYESEKLYSDALSQWLRVIYLYPCCAEAYCGAIQIYLDEKDYKHAEEIARKGMKNVEYPNLNLLVKYAILKNSQKKYNDALQLLSEVRKYFPDSDRGYIHTALVYENMGNVEGGGYQTAEKICEEGLVNCKNKLGIYQTYINIISRKNIPEKIKLEEIYSKRVRLYNTYPDNIEELVKLANTCSKLAKYDQSLNKIYNSYVSQILQRRTKIKNNFQQKADYKNKKICFFLWHLVSLKYYITVVKHINPSLIDLVVGQQGRADKKVKKDLGLQEYTLKYGITNINNYDYTVTDGVTLFWFNDWDKYTTKFISLPHVIDRCVSYTTIGKSTLCIHELAHEPGYESVLPTKLLSTENMAEYEQIPPDRRCEITHTGMYHIANIMNTDEHKKMCRRKLVQTWGYNLDPDKPLVVLFEDENSYLGQIVYCLNRLVDMANIIIKPININYTSELLKKLDKRIIVFKDKSWVQDVLRYSADFIFAGYCSGSLFSALMLGLNVIPYYSRLAIIKKKKMDRRARKFYSSYLDLVNNKNSSEFMRMKIFENIRLFDLCDVNSIRKAIKDDEYIRDYRAKLPVIQKEIFGNCVPVENEKAARKTAEYILRYSFQGTLAKDCEAVYLKDSCFSA